MNNNLSNLLVFLKIKPVTLSQELNISKSYLSRYTNERILKPTNKYYQSIKNYLLTNYYNELLDYFNVDHNFLEERYDKYVQYIKVNDNINEFFNDNSNDLLIKIDNVKTLIKEFKRNISYSYDYINNIVKKNKINIYFSSLNKEIIFSFCVYFMYDILQGNINVFKSNKISNNNIYYFKNEKCLLQTNFKNSSIIFNKPSLNEKDKTIFNRMFGDLSFNSKNVFLKTLGSMANYYSDTISNNITGSKNNKYYVSHPHYSCMDQNLVNTVLANYNISKNELNKINEIMSARQLITTIDVYCTYDSLINKNENIISDGLSIFFKQQIIFSKQMYLAYLKQLLKKIEDKTIRLHIIDFKLKTYFSILDNLIIVYPPYISSNKNNTIYVKDENLIHLMKKNLLLFLKEESKKKIDSVAILKNIIALYEQKNNQ